MSQGATLSLSLTHSGSHRPEQGWQRRWRLYTSAPKTKPRSLRAALPPGPSALPIPPGLRTPPPARRRSVHAFPTVPLRPRSDSSRRFNNLPGLAPLRPRGSFPLRAAQRPGLELPGPSAHPARSRRPAGLHAPRAHSLRQDARAASQGAGAASRSGTPRLCRLGSGRGRGNVKVEDRVRCLALSTFELSVFASSGRSGESIPSLLS